MRKLTCIPNKIKDWSGQAEIKAAEIGFELTCRLAKDIIFYIRAMKVRGKANDGDRYGKDA
jgi:hypothetical protein